MTDPSGPGPDPGGPPTSGAAYGQPASGQPYYGPPQSGAPYSGAPYSGAPYSGHQQPYGQPPYGPPPGYGGYPVKPVDDTRNWLLITHFGGVAGVVAGGTAAGWVAPLIAYTTKGPTNPTVRAHAVEALNFHVTWAIANVVALVIYFCGGFLTLGIGLFFLWILPLATFVIAVAFGIVAGVKASNGEFYRYPMSVKMFR